MPSFPMPKPTEDQRNNAIGRLQAGSNQGHLARHTGTCRATSNRLWVRYNTRNVCDKPGNDHGGHTSR